MAAVTAPAASAGDVVPAVTKKVGNCSFTVRLYAPYWGYVQMLSSGSCTSGSIKSDVTFYSSNGTQWRPPATGTSTPTPFLLASPAVPWGARGTRWTTCIYPTGNQPVCVNDWRAP